MLELVDLTKALDKPTYKKVFSELEVRLGECQRRALSAGIPVVIVFEGWEAAGKGSLINRLTQAMDPRGFKVHPVNAATEEERLRPWMWRFWCAMPPAGSFAVFDRSWYGRVLIERVQGELKKRDLAQSYDDIEVF